MGGEFSGILVQLYQCPTHGYTWHADLVNDIDCENDDVYAWYACPQCHAEVRPVICDGKPVLHPLTDDDVRAEWESETAAWVSEEIGR